MLGPDHTYMTLVNIRRSLLVQKLPNKVINPHSVLQLLRRNSNNFAVPGSQRSIPSSSLSYTTSRKSQRDRANDKHQIDKAGVDNSTGRWSLANSCAKSRLDSNIFPTIPVWHLSDTEGIDRYSSRAAANLQFSHEPLSLCGPEEGIRKGAREDRDICDKGSMMFLPSWLWI